MSRFPVARVLCSVGPACVLACALAAGPAAAQEAHTSANVRFLKNIPYSLRWDSPTPAGTDMEFATLTLPSPAVPGAAPPATPTAEMRRRPPARAKYNRCIKKARKVRSKRRRARAVKRCRRLLEQKRRPKARRSLADVDPGKAGVQRTFAFAGSYVNGLHIIDVSDPPNPVLVADYDCGISQGDVQVFHRPDLGRTLATYASDDGYSSQPDSRCFVEADALGHKATDADGDGTFLVDVTDPYHPKTVSFVLFDKGSHNQTVHPNGRYLYNSNADIATDTDPGIEIADISDPAKPKAVTVLPMPIRPGLASNAHDITFNADGTRAYAATGSHTSILDTTDPADPKIISTLWDPAINVPHQAEAIKTDIPGLGERTVLLVSDEFAAGASTGQCPNGGLHLYDVSSEVEAAPVKLGYWNISEMRPTDAGPSDVCTAHVWQIHHDPKLMIIAWYNAGFRVIDLSTLGGVAFGGQGAGMREIGFGRMTGGSAWAAKAPDASRDEPFVIYSNDELRGFDAWSFDPTAAPSD